jgi:hypothetical protein
MLTPPAARGQRDATAPTCAPSRFLLSWHGPATQPEVLEMRLPLFLALLFLPLAASARDPADALKGRIVLSLKSFPMHFKSDDEFIKTMKHADTKGFQYATGSDTIAVEFMAFFAEPIQTTELEAKIYDVTEARPVMKDNFPVYPGQRGLRILNSNFEMKAGTLDVERRYQMVLTEGFRGRVLAETTFAIKRSPGHDPLPTTPQGQP